MYVSKTKNYSVIPLSEVKQFLSITPTDTSLDSDVTQALRAALDAVSKRTASDIVPTVNQLEDYDKSGNCYRINEANITITGITVTNNLLTSPTTTTITGYTIQKHNQYTLVRFYTYVTAEKLNIGYTSGYSSIPDDLKRAIKMLTSQFLDIDKSGYVQNVTETKAIDRFITPYINVLY